MDYSKLNSCLYVRKSTEDKDKQVQSIDDQISAMKQRANSLGVSLPRKGVFKESKSAKAPGVRPEFSRMVDAIREGNFNAIICWSTSRLARNPQEAGIIQQLLQDDILKCIVTNDKIYLPSDNAVVFAVEMGINSQFIRDLMASVRRGMYSKAEKGWRPGVPPIGYKNDRENKIIIDDPERFDLVRKMWGLMLTGTYTVKNIADIAEKDWD